MPKGLLQVEGIPWFLHHLRHFFSTGGTHAIIVLGFHSDKYLEAFPLKGNLYDEDWKEYGGLQLAVSLNLMPQEGQFSSILCGLRRLSREPFPGAFILPVDMLSPGKNTWDALRGGLPGPGGVCIPSWNGHGGHPVLLSEKFIRHLLSLQGSLSDTRLDHEIKKLPGDLVRYVETDDMKVTGNVNSLADFLEL